MGGLVIFKLGGRFALSRAQLALIVSLVEVDSLHMGPGISPVFEDFQAHITLCLVYPIHHHNTELTTDWIDDRTILKQNKENRL